MYRSINDFLENWKSEEEMTLKIFSLITNETKNTIINEHVRSLGRLSWHLTQTITEMGTRAGIFAEDNLEGLPIPDSMEEIIEAYKNSSELLCRNVNLKWTDSALENLVAMYGEDWKKGKILHVLLVHQTHHRGQMTVIMRMLGLPVAGIYGPTKEEWQAMGIPAMD